MRYFVKCKYKGTNYHGWQRQPDTPLTVQEQIENAIRLVTRKSSITIVGCGRTDTGVHAAEYFFHFDTDFSDIDTLLFKLNQITNHNILCTAILPVNEGAHARFDASLRGYTYFITKERDPFRLDTAYTHVKVAELELSLLNQAAKLLIGERSFDAFCKTHTDVKTKICTVSESKWTETADGYQYTIRANRFLRGMIRLVVGMCINVSRGKVSLEEVSHAITNKHRLATDWSVPAKGLFLDKVSYPDETFELGA